MFRSPRRPGVRVCGARLSGDRGRCRAIAIWGRLRCRWHGGRATGPRTPCGKRRSVAAMIKGRVRWIERMREAKRLGLIEKIPGGRPKKGAVVKSAVKEVNQARAVVASRRASILVEPEKPWANQTHAEQLNTLTGKALDVTRQILDLPGDPGNLKLLSIQKDAALSVLSTQTKVDENRLRAQRPDGLAEILRKIREADESKD